MSRQIRPQVATRIHAHITLLFARHCWRESGNLKSYINRVFSRLEPFKIKFERLKILFEPFKIRFNNYQSKN